MTDNIWGFLAPAYGLEQRIDLTYAHTWYKIGSDARLRPRTNTITLPEARKCDRTHMFIYRTKKGNTTLIAQQSRDYYTYIDGFSFLGGQSCRLCDGSVIDIGSSVGHLTFVYYTFNPNQLPISFTYHFGQTLGSGAFGTVKTAKHRVSLQNFAVKILKRTWPRLPISREIDIMKAVEHPRIVSIFEFFETKTNVYLVMELLPEGNLMQRIESSGSLDDSETKTICWDVFSAMEYLHSLGFAHRDLKPEGRTYQHCAKVADFGLAKSFQGDTFLQSICGSPGYMAPEIWPLRCQLEYDQRVDSWSMGITMFIMVSAQFPYPDDDEILTELDFLRHRRLQWDGVPDGVGWPVRDIIQRFLIKDPEARLTFTTALKHVWFRMEPLAYHTIGANSASLCAYSDGTDDEMEEVEVLLRSSNSR